MKFAAVLMLLCLGACGQKGPLFLPQPAQPQPEAPAPQSAPAQVDQAGPDQPAHPAD